MIGFIETVAAPKLEHHDAFLARVAVNALNTIRRELEQGRSLEDAARVRLAGLLGRDGTFAELNGALCEAIRTGALGADSPGLLEHLRRETLARVAIDQPNYAGLAAARERASD